MTLAEQLSAAVPKDAEAATKLLVDLVQKSGLLDLTEEEAAKLQALGGVKNVLRLLLVLQRVVDDVATSVLGLATPRHIRLNDARVNDPARKSLKEIDAERLRRGAGVGITATGLNGVAVTIGGRDAAPADSPTE